MDRAEARREAKAQQKSARRQEVAELQKQRRARVETGKAVKQYKRDMAGIDESYVDPTVAKVSPELIALMYPPRPRILSKRDIDAMNEQSLARRYDEHDRNCSGQPIPKQHEDRQQ
ncbi:MAG: hypothetical protein MUD11_13465 [Rhodobacteraceae bacterium]|jgi:hypothetical protein|nr:hypothetical protein [Paracoccaceae bacterium]